MKKLKQMPVPVAALIMVALMLVGLAFGNHNALKRAMAAPDAIFEEVSALASERANEAANLVVVAGRYDVEQRGIDDLQGAIDAVKDAGTPKKVAAANQTITSKAQTLYEQVEPLADDYDRRLATGVMDNLTSKDQMLTRKGNEYNTAIQSVLQLEKKLPMRWVIGGAPEVYQ